MIRDDIVNEFIDRIKLVLPDARYQDNPPDYDPAKLPQFSVFEDEEKSVFKRRFTQQGKNAYIRTLPLWVEYAFKVKKKDVQKFPLGRAALSTIRGGVEKDGNLNGLVDWFAETGNEIVTIWDNMVVVIMEYTIVYPDIV